VPRQAECYLVRPARNNVTASALSSVLTIGVRKKNLNNSAFASLHVLMLEDGTVNPIRVLVRHNCMFMVALDFVARFASIDVIVWWNDLL
jgi:hypothetical protein